MLTLQRPSAWSSPSLAPSSSPVGCNRRHATNPQHSARSTPASPKDFTSSPEWTPRTFPRFATRPRLCTRVSLRSAVCRWVSRFDRGRRKVSTGWCRQLARIAGNASPFQQGVATVLRLHRRSGSSPRDLRKPLRTAHTLPLSPLRQRTLTPSSPFTSATRGECSCRH